ncbi:OLC1v1013886C1 [Oldenlandia corymbosa var. corymbosa]|uniref:OLC1v1013886C1 n=1 Tax=Oldenlandia corymbosa var. corymbosa TaxID=529605 RepID=A0AAV1DZH7_OLDCO|nr:OLC1v1013886C1 [Oldenlandia corymbosa var. corymbosa]
MGLMRNLWNNSRKLEALIMVAVARCCCYRGRAGAANLDVIQVVEYVREEAIKSFKQGANDVLIATDVASKGIDFRNIQHVINYDMLAEFENYVHRIGRTGRCGKTGIATTFINRNQRETTLLDLKHLLQEAKQRVPPLTAADLMHFGVNSI